MPTDQKLSEGSVEGFWIEGVEVRCRGQPTARGFNKFSVWSSRVNFWPRASNVEHFGSGNRGAISKALKGHPATVELPESLSLKP